MQTAHRGIYTNLCAVDLNNQIISIPNQVLRKSVSFDEQHSLNDNSICIVCHYSFNEEVVEWSPKIKAICHPFHRAKFFPDDKKTYNLSESDFSDKLWFPVGEDTPEMKYDYVCFTFDSRHGMKTKGLFMLPLFLEVTWGRKMKGLVIDYSGHRSEHEGAQLGSTGQHLQITRKRIKSLQKKQDVDIRRGAFSQEEVANFIKSSKCVVFFNTADASPRLLTEALICGRPVVVNSNIYGGWKYVNNNNGYFFNGAISYQNMEDKKSRIYRRMRRICDYIEDVTPDSLNIKEAYYEEYGLINASRRLANIINEIEQKEKYRFVFYPELQEAFERNIQLWQ